MPPPIFIMSDFPVKSRRIRTYQGIGRSKLFLRCICSRLVEAGKVVIKREPVARERLIKGGALNYRIVQNGCYG